MHPRRFSVPAVLIAVSAASWASGAQAIPAFARRYETSCQTCHVAFPRLTPFGEAFRRNAYRFPGGADATAEKEEPLGLGNPAMAERFPAAVWPGQMGRSLPLSIVVDGRLTIGPEPEGHVAAGHGHGEGATADPHATSQKATLGELGGHVGLRAAGSLGTAASMLASVDVGGHEAIAVERAFVNLTPLGDTALHVRVGRLEPTLHGVSIHRGLLGHQLRLTGLGVGSNPFAPEPNQTGVELSGVAAGRLGWVVGALENAGGGTGWRKDALGRIEYKLGGMRLDGLNPEAGNAAWSERSLLVAVSAWSGRAGIVKAGSHLYDEDFLRIGGDLHAIFDDVLVDLVAARQTHKPRAADGAESAMDLAYAELTWMAAAAVFPTARFEWAKTTKVGATEQVRWLATLQATAIIRPNLVLRLAADAGTEPAESIHFRSVIAAFSAAF